MFIIKCIHSQAKLPFSVGVRFVETVCYVYHKMHSLSSGIAIILLFAVGLGMCLSSRWFARFHEKVCSLSSELLIFCPYPFGVGLCISSRRFAMFHQNVCSLSSELLILFPYMDVKHYMRYNART